MSQNFRGAPPVRELRGRVAILNAANTTPLPRPRRWGWRRRMADFLAGAAAGVVGTLSLIGWLS